MSSVEQRCLPGYVWSSKLSELGFALLNVGTRCHV